MKKKRIIIADDHGILRFGLRQFLSKFDDIEVVGEASTGDHCLQLYKQKNPDVCLIDIEMPGKNGIEVAQAIRAVDPEVKLIILSMHSDPDTYRQTMAAGVDGYLMKNTSKKKILDAIRDAAAGKKLTGNPVPNSAAAATAPHTVTTGTKVGNITDREMEVLQLVVAGYSSSQIADKLHISPRTVDTHRNNMMQKLDIHNTASLVRFALKHKLVEVS